MIPIKIRLSIDINDFLFCGSYMNPLTNDRGEETDVKGAMEHAENTFRQIGQDIKEIKEQISGLKP